mgnify:CR=1 FL=1
MTFRYEDWSADTVTYGVVAYCSENIYHSPHLHSQVELIIVEKGSAVAVVDGRKFAMEEGSGILICPHIVHEIYSDDKDSLTCVFIFGTEFISECKAFFESNSVHFVRLDKNSCPDFAKDQIKYLVDFAHNYSIGRTVVKGMLTVLLSGIMPAYSGVEFEKFKERSNNYEICRRLLLYIDSNISSDLSLETISKALNIVPSYVSTVFSRNFKTSLNSYISKKRISVAKSLLMDSHKSITEIAFESGFSSIRSFNRRFKESEGLTPSDFRESFMNSDKKK